MTTDSRNTDGRAGDPDPYPNYAWLREKAPVSRVHNPHSLGTTWMVTSYPIARTALADHRLSHDDRTRGGTERDSEREGRGLLGLEGQNHTRLRSVLNAAFSSRTVQAWAPMIAKVASRAVDRFAATGQADLVAEFALPVPVEVIHKIIGVPSDATGDPQICFDLFKRAGLRAGGDEEAEADLMAYVDEIVVYKRKHPGQDIGTLLIDARAAGTLHTDAELHAVFLGLLGAGHVSTTQFFGCAFLRLIGQPELLAKLSNPEFDWTAGIDEMLRVDPPFQITGIRYATEDLELGKTRIARGDGVIVALAGANRDPCRYADPDTLNFERQYRSNLAFGRGPHLCLGIQLARLEAKIGIQTVFTRLPSLRLGIRLADVVWDHGPALRGPRSVPVLFSPTV